MISIKVKDDASKTLKEWFNYSHTGIVDGCNQHLYYALRNTVNETYAPTNEKIESDLKSASKQYPRASLVNILINKERGQKGMKGLSGEKMARAVERFIKNRRRHRNATRSGWLPAIRILASLVPKKGGKAIPSGSGKIATSFGGVKPARRSIIELKPFALAWNNVLDTIKGAYQPKVRKYLEDGAEKGLQMEVNSMKQYIIRKMNEAQQKFWRK